MIGKQITSRQMVVVCVLVMGLEVCCAGKTITVDDFGSANYNRIQYAVDSAADGDEIVVMDGTYTGVGNRDIEITKKITLRSKNGPDYTIIDCQGTASNAHFGIHCSASSTLQGFTIKNAYSDGYGAVTMGDDGIVANCIITDNTSSGILCEAEGSLVIVNCLIARNAAELGGGIWCTGGAKPNIINCTIAGNMANYGGGVLAQSVKVYEEEDETIYTSHPVMINSIIRDNLALYGGSQICVGYGDDASELSTTIAVAAEVTVLYSNVQGGSAGIYKDPNSTVNWGDGNINSDPKFVDKYNGDYHILFNSTCRDTGFSLAVAEYDTDLDGNPRKVGNAVDMGAYEIQDMVTVDKMTMLINNNGQLNFALKGTFDTESISGLDVKVRFGDYEQVLTINASNFIIKSDGDHYVYKGAKGGITSAKFTLSKGVFLIEGKNIAASLVKFPVTVEVAFGDF